MAVRLLANLFGFPADTIVRDLSYSIEMKLVDKLLASYDVTSGTEQSRAAFPSDMSSDEREAYLTSQLSETENWSGWGDYSDATHTDGSPQALAAGVATKIQIAERQQDRKTYLRFQPLYRLQLQA